MAKRGGPIAWRVSPSGRDIDRGAGSNTRRFNADIRDIKGIFAQPVIRKRYGTRSVRTFVSPQVVDQKTSLARQLEAAVSADEAAVGNVQTQLKYATVAAPIAGVIGFTTVNVGALVAAGSTDIVTITQLDPIAVVSVAPGDKF